MAARVARGRGHRLRARRRSRRRRRARPACRSRRRARGWWFRSPMPRRPASAQAIASSVTLPNASVIDGLKNTSVLASARAGRRRPDGRGRSRSGRRFSNHGRAGPSPMTSTWCLTLRSARTSMASANTSRPFSITTRPRKAMTSSSSSIPSARRHAMSRRPGLNCSRSTPRVQIEMSRFMRWARSTAAVDSAGRQDRVAALIERRMIPRASGSRHCR